MSDLNEELARQRQEELAHEDHYDLRHLKASVESLWRWLREERERRKQAYKIICYVSDMRDAGILVDEVFSFVQEKIMELKLIKE